MQGFKDKFAINLQNAQRILQLLRQTHRQRIQQAHSSDESSHLGKADHTFQSPQHTVLQQKTKHNRVARPLTVADKLQRDFLTKTYHEYQCDLETIHDNQQNVLQAIEKVAERLNYLADSEDIIERLLRKNSQLDEEIREFQAENMELEQRLTKEGFADMRVVEQTHRHLRNLVKNCEPDGYYVGFANKWNQYLGELATKPDVQDIPKLERMTAEQVTKTVAASMINDSEPTKPAAPPAMTKKKSQINADLLGNLKEFSKNLKLPTKK